MPDLGYETASNGVASLNIRADCAHAGDASQKGMYRRAEAGVVEAGKILTL